MLASSRKPCGAGASAGGYGIRPYGMGAGVRRLPAGGILPGGNPPVCGLCPQTALFDKGAYSVRVLGAARTGGVPVAAGAGGMNPAPTNKFYVLGDRGGCGRAL